MFRISEILSEARKEAIRAKVKVVISYTKATCQELAKYPKQVGKNIAEGTMYCLTEATIAEEMITLALAVATVVVAPLFPIIASIQLTKNIEGGLLMKVLTGVAICILAEVIVLNIAEVAFALAIPVMAIFVRDFKNSIQKNKEEIDRLEAAKEGVA